MLIEVADLFCGAGGSSTGAALAIEEAGHELALWAVNHWDRAIETHTRNHPKALHFCVNLDAARPQEIVKSGRLDLLMASPECTGHSRARGGKPVSDQMRMSPWHIQRWCTVLDVDCVLVENVPEFVEWGPVCSFPAGHAGPHREGGRAPAGKDCGTPIPEKKRVYFEAWVQSMWALGYALEWRVLNAADFGDATTRRRFFLIARKDGKPIRWPEPTHSKDGSTGPAGLFAPLKKWRPAREVINLSKPGPSLLRRKQQHSVNTRLRIGRGLMEFCGPLGLHYTNLLDLPRTREAAAKELSRKKPYRDASPEKKRALEDALLAKVKKVYATTPKRESPVPFLVRQRDSTDVEGAAVPSKSSTVDEPTPAITTVARIGLATPVVVQTDQTGGNGAYVRSADEPLPAVVTKQNLGLATPSIEPFVQGNREHNAARSMDEPIPTATSSTGGGMHVVSPFLMAMGGGGEPRSADEPVPTIVGKGGGSVTMPFLDAYYGKGTPRSVDEPIRTVTGTETHGLVTPALVVPYGPKADARPVDEPLHTIPTKERLAVASFVLNRHQNDGARDVDEPIPTVTGSGGGYLTQPFVHQYNGDPTESRRVHSLDDPLGTITAEGKRFAVVSPFLTPNFGEDNRGKGQSPRIRSWDDPVPTVTGRGAGNVVIPTIAGGSGECDPRELVWIDDVLYRMDIHYRMLENPELAGAMSFDARGKYDFVGTKAEVTKQIGNAVPVRLAAALVGAIVL